jgi:hypothetical protein
VPGDPLAGVNPVIVGPAEELVTVNAPLLVADPPGAVTVSGPVEAPAGTVAVMAVAVAAVIVPVVPLNETES